MNGNKSPEILLFKAAANLAVLCQNIDENPDENIDSYLKREFFREKGNLITSVDFIKAFNDEIESKIALIEHQIEKLESKKKQALKIQDRLEQSVIAAMEANPNLPYQDSWGTKLKITRNSIPTLKVKESTEIPNEYYGETVHKWIDKERIRNDILAGKEVTFATLEYGKHLRGL